MKEVLIMNEVNIILRESVSACIVVKGFNVRV